MSVSHGQDFVNLKFDYIITIISAGALFIGIDWKKWLITNRSLCRDGGWGSCTLEWSLCSRSREIGRWPEKRI
jgi:hypothetical protein